MARLELYPGEALSHRQEVVARADEYLAWAADHPQDSGSYQAWLGTRLLSSFTQGINIALPPKNTLRTDRFVPSAARTFSGHQGTHTHTHTHTYTTDANRKAPHTPCREVWERSDINCVYSCVQDAPLGGLAVRNARQRTHRECARRHSLCVSARVHVQIACAVARLILPQRLHNGRRVR